MARPKKQREPREIPLQQIRTTAELGRVIRERRQASDANLAEAAGLSGVGVRFLHELEHGKQTASLGKALQVLDRLGLELWIAPRGKGPRPERK